ncbi:hypothetical protein F3Y22_tig00110540pilonHSYRG00025 [Hibiscus syriacus]|uniref:Uncharacterized protein n=1 Tax=Hibiscus syriacus TaxID=106335 RepID=A0A6A3ACA9_HIBSY|nr:hypothetical protein F3Y22_tig00110540pilonHSYRG00025 [Hibiscus syriacus]
MTNIERTRRHIGMSSSCPVCGNGDETILHVLRDCLSARMVWSQLIPPHHSGSFLSSSLLDWLSSNSPVSGFTGEEFYWRHLFGIIILHLWKQRNNFVFKGQIWSTPAIIHSAWSWAKMIYTSHSSVHHQTHRVATNQRWCPPSTDLLKLNIDAVVNHATLDAAGGGVFRDNEGAWVVG